MFKVMELSRSQIPFTFDKHSILRHKDNLEFEKNDKNKT